MARPNTRADVLKRFEESLLPDTAGCLLWQGWRDPDGYGRLRFEGEVRVHRVAYMIANGAIAPGMDVDHLCHNADSECPGGTVCRHRACVNPEHLGLASRAENSKRAAWRRAVCRHGHEFDEANTHVLSTGVRQCRTCNAAAARRLKERKKAAAAAAKEVSAA